MRTDTAAFAAFNKSPNKEPRYVIEQAFDEAATDLHYFTSHPDAALPPGAIATLDVVEAISGTSQKLSPDVGTASIGNINYSLIDPDGVIRDLFGNKLASAKSLRNKRTRAYMGYAGLPWSDYTLVTTQLVRKINQKDHIYNNECNDVQRQARKDIFNLFQTNLSASINAAQLLIPVYSVTGIELNLHGTSYTDAPGQSVMYIHIEDEVIRCTGSTVDGSLGLCFVANQRGALNTRAVEHTVDPNASPDKRKKVEEYVYLEMPAPKLIYSLLTGSIYEPENRFTYSEALDNAAWNKSGGSVTANQALDFDGELTLEKFTENTSTGQHGIDRVTGGAGSWCFSFDVKAAERTVLYSSIFNGTDGLNAQVVLDLTTGVASNTVGEVSIQKRGDVYRVTLKGTSTVSTVCYVRCRNGGAISYTGDGVSGMYFGRMQLAKDPLGDKYYKTEATALVPSYATLPSNWHLGISPDYVRLSDFTDIGPDLWDPTDDTKGFPARITGHEKTDGKKFIETQLYLLLGAYPPVYSDGSLGMRRMTGVLSDSSAVRELNTNNIYSYGELTQDLQEVHNQVFIAWNWDPIEKRYTRFDLMLDEDSAGVYPDAPVKKLEFRALSGYSHTFEIIGARFDALRDRYAAPPYHLDLVLTPDQNDIEVGDIVRVKLDQIDDYHTKAPLDRAFEVQQVSINWFTGLVSVSLFASTQAAGAIVRHTETTVLNDAFYSAAGTELSNYLNTNYPGSFAAPGGVGHIQGNCTLPGGTVLADGVYYYLGDLTLDAGVIANWTQNIQINVMGYLTINGEFNGAGAGLAPGGGNGFVGVTRASGGFNLYFTPSLYLKEWVQNSFEGGLVRAANEASPTLSLVNNSTSLAGLPTDLRGAPGAKGGDVIINDAVVATGGAGGNSGAGALFIARGISFGGAGKINTSGTQGSTGATYDYPPPGWAGCAQVHHSGGGSAGHPGAVYFLIDGNGVTPTLSNIQADQPGVIDTADPLDTPGTVPHDTLCSIYNIHSHFVGTSALAHSGSVARIQFLPKSEAVEEDETLYPPDVKSITVMQNGEVEVIKWPAVDYLRLGGYEIRYTPGTQNNWDNGTPLTFETKGTNITTADLPPGYWRVYIKAVDRINGNKSINAASKTITIISTYDVIDQQPQATAWLGTLTGFHKHHTGVLIPLSTKNANEVTFDEQFHQFVPYPVSESIYEAPEFDIAFNDTPRVYGPIESELGYGKTGVADPQLEIDYKLEAGAYDGFAPWSSGFLTARYFKFRLVQDNTKGVAIVKQFTPTVDAQPKHDKGKNIDIAPGGTYVPFNIQFHAPPIVKLILNENADKNPVPSSITTTGFTANVWQNLVDVGGAINYEADGE